MTNLAIASNNTRTAQPVLAQVPAPIPFDPDNRHHRLFFAMFLEEGRWSPQAPRFQVEWPHTSAVTTIQTKLTKFALRKETAKLEALVAKVKAHRNAA